MQVIAFRSNGDTSNIERVFLYKDSGATAGTEGDPITGLTNASTGLNISTIANNEATANTDTSAATSSIETIATLGTYATPTAGFVRFKEVDATNMPGLYEIQWENARYAVASAIWLDITISGVADLAPFHGRIYLKALPANVTELGGVAQSATDLKDFADAGYDPATNKVQGVVLVDTTTTATTATNLTNLPTIPANWLTAAGIAATALNGKGDWNVGKTGYSLTQTFPTNFADMAITVTTGQVTVGTNNDKTGYSLTQAFPTNFADLAVTATTGLVDITQAAADKAWSATTRVLTANTNLNDPTAAAVADAVLDEALSGHIAAGSLGKAVADIETDAVAIEVDTQDIQSRLPAALVGGKMDSDAVAVSGSTAAADKLEAHAAAVITGATTGTPTTTSSNTDLTGFADDELIGRVIVFTGGTANGEASDITDYVSLNGVVTYTAIPTAPTVSDTFVVI